MQFCRRYYEELFCEIILYLGQRFRRCHLKGFLSKLWQPSCQWSKTISAIVKEGHHRDIYVKLYEIWISGSGGDAV